VEFCVDDDSEVEKMCLLSSALKWFGNYSRIGNDALLRR
jgi:hypothetical protein